MYMVWLEWTFFTTAHLALCFWFVAETVLIKHPNFGWACSVLRHLSLLPLCLHHPCLTHQQTGLGWATDWEGTQAWQASWTGPWSIPYHRTMLCNESCSTGSRKEVRAGSTVAAAQRLSGDLPASESRQLIPSLSFVSHQHPSFTYSTVSLDPQSFSSFQNS